MDRGEGAVLVPQRLHATRYEVLIVAVFVHPGC